MGTHYGKGTLEVSTDGGETWQKLSGSQYVIVHDESDGTKEVVDPTVLMPARTGMSGTLYVNPDCAKELVRFIEKITSLGELCGPAPKKKKAQWKQSPLSRFSR